MPDAGDAADCATLTPRTESLCAALGVPLKPWQSHPCPASWSEENSHWMESLGSNPGLYQTNYLKKWLRASSSPCSRGNYKTQTQGRKHKMLQAIQKSGNFTKTTQSFAEVSVFVSRGYKLWGWSRKCLESLEKLNVTWIQNYTEMHYKLRC